MDAVGFVLHVVALLWVAGFFWMRFNHPELFKVNGEQR